MAFSLQIDTAEQRIATDRIVALCNGRQWDEQRSTAFVDGITQTGMLAPLPLTPEWETTTSGDYARLGKSAYTFDLPPFVAEGTPPPYPDGSPGSPDKWNEFNYGLSGDVFMQAQGVNDRAITNARYDKNRAFHLAWFAYNEGKTSQVQIEFGWISENGFIGCYCWTDGKIQIFKNGTQVGQGNAFERKVTTQTIYGKERSSQNLHHKARKGDAKQLAQQLVQMQIIPCRRRDLLFLTNQGGGFRFTFADLDPDNPDNEITPAKARFFWRVSQGQATVQCAPLRFKTSGYLLSDAFTLSEPPVSLANGGHNATVSAYLDQPGLGTGTYGVTLIDASDVSLPEFHPNNTKDRVRLKVDLTSDGTGSYWVYGAAGVFDAITKNTQEKGYSSTDITSYVQQASLSVPENPADVLFKVTCNKPLDMEEAGTYFISQVANRSIEAGFDGISFLTGRSKTPNRKNGNTDDNSHLMLEFRDRCKALEEYRFKQALPYDGMELADALTSIVMLVGIPAEQILIAPFGFNLPTIGQSSEGEFALYPEVGDKAIDWLLRLLNTYAPHCDWGFVPTADGSIFMVRSLDDLNAQDPVYTLYTSIDDAINIGGLSRSDAPMFVCRTMDYTPIECEANDIYVTGRDPRTAQIIQVRLQDTASCDPTTIPSLRPRNWLGEPRPYAWADPSITDIDTASWVAACLQRRLTQTRELYPFTTEFMVTEDGSPVWKGDVITLYGIGDVRITTLSAQFQTVGDELIWRPTHYTSEFVRYPTL